MPKATTSWYRTTHQLQSFGCINKYSSATNQSWRYHCPAETLRGSKIPHWRSLPEGLRGTKMVDIRASHPLLYSTTISASSASLIRLKSSSLVSLKSNPDSSTSRTLAGSASNLLASSIVMRQPVVGVKSANGFIPYFISNLESRIMG